jgi:DNA polymerase elongation subunit (family B)
VAQAYGYGGKLDDLTAIDAVKYSSKDVLLRYNARDVNLTRQILQHENYEILDLFYLISKVAKIRFALACHSGPTIAWASVIDNTGYELPRLPEKAMIPYRGALVFDPERAETIGDYRNIYSVDFTSLYPYSIILANLSSETICCECCKDIPEARVPSEIIEDINAWAATDHKDSEKQSTHPWRIWYWICQKRKGLLPALLEEYTKERSKYKKTNFALQYVLKIMMNSLYGCTGTSSYKYRDVRVAELTTAFARRSLTTLRKIATEEFGLRETYSDTDSIFLQGFIDDTHFKRFQKVCEEKLIGLELEPKVLEQFLLTDSKSYIATSLEKDKQTGELKRIIEKVGLQGLKSDVSKWIKQAVEQFVKDYVDSNVGTEQIIANVKKAYEDMLAGKVPRELLKMYEKVGQDPNKYVEGHHLRRLALEQGVTQGGRVFYYYSMVDDGRYETNPIQLSTDRYMEDFETAFKKLVNLVDNGKYNYYTDIIGIEEHEYKEKQKAKARQKKQDPHQEALL